MLMHINNMRSLELVELGQLLVMYVECGSLHCLSAYSLMVPYVDFEATEQQFKLKRELKKEMEPRKAQGR